MSQVRSLYAFLQRPWVLYLLSALVLWMNFGGHYFSSLSVTKYLDNEFPSERFVISRLAHNLEHGLEDEGGFMLRYEAVEHLNRSVNKEDYELFKTELQNELQPAEIYLSHAGLQDDLMWPLWQGLEWVKAKVLDRAREGSRWQKRMQTLDLYYYHLISMAVLALVNALVLAGFVLWVGRQFSSLHGWIVLGLMLLMMPILTFYGRSMWWMMWSWFLPMMVVLYGAFWRSSEGKAPGWGALIAMAVLAGGAVGLKVMMGYEYVSTVMVAAMVPLVFYALYHAWGFWRWFGASAVVGSGVLAGALAGIWGHIEALKRYGVDPMEVLRSKFEARAYGGQTLEGLQNAAIQESVDASFLNVLGSYLIDPKELAWPQILLMLPFLLWCFSYFRSHRANEIAAERRLWDALVGAIGVSFLGAVSMLVILKAHTFIHGYDIVIWAIPLNLFLALFYALRLKRRV